MTKQEVRKQVVDSLFKVACTELGVKFRADQKSMTLDQLNGEKMNAMLLEKKMTKRNVVAAIAQYFPFIPNLYNRGSEEGNIRFMDDLRTVRTQMKEIANTILK